MPRRIGQQFALGDAQRTFGHAASAFMRLTHINQQHAFQLSRAGLLRGKFTNAHAAIIGQEAGHRGPDRSYEAPERRRRPSGRLLLHHFLPFTCFIKRRLALTCRSVNGFFLPS
ncbi:hypothetical protein D9M71_837230 [compost metagenome]